MRAFLLHALRFDRDPPCWRVGLAEIRAGMPQILDFPTFSAPYEGPALFVAGERSDYITDEDRPRIRALFPARASPPSKARGIGCMPIGRRRSWRSCRRSSPPEGGGGNGEAVAMLHLDLPFLAELRVEVAEPIDIGETAAGRRRLVPILSGRLEGPAIAGEVLPGGADVQILRADGVTELAARHAVRLADGGMLFVVNRGLRDAAPEDMARLLRGEPVPPERVYFRTIARFETAAPALARWQRRLILGLGERRPREVIVRFYEL